MVERHFVTVPGPQGARQVHYRRAGSGPTVVVLHESPLSGRAYAGLAEELARNGFTGIALDHPGYGSSDPLPQESPEIADFTDALVETLDALGIERAALYGAHTGACIALDAAVRHPARVTAVCLDGLPLFTEEERDLYLRQYTPRFEPRWDGGHILAAFTTRRDMKLFFPWFRKEEATRLAIAVPPAEQLHEETLDLLRARDTFHLGYRAAFRYRVEEPLARVGLPTAVTARGDEILGAQLARLGAVSPQVAVELLPNDRGAWAAAICRLFAERPAGSVAPAAPATAPAPGPDPGRLWRAYTRTAGAGELLVRRGGPRRPAGPAGTAAPRRTVPRAAAPARSCCCTRRRSRVPCSSRSRPRSRGRALLSCSTHRATATRRRSRASRGSPTSRGRSPPASIASSSARSTSTAPTPGPASPPRPPSPTRRASTRSCSTTRRSSTTSCDRSSSNGSAHRS